MFLVLAVTLGYTKHVYVRGTKI